ncbi:MAG: relaxase/mobilization nuclease domain-containing protein [Weeksellaceae bacterium]
MVGKGASTKGSAKAFDYILDDLGKAIELDRHLVGGKNGLELLKEFRFVQQFNHDCENNTFSFVLSPSPDRDYKISELREYAQEFIDEMKLNEHQWIATIHHSTKTKHIHIIANRIHPMNGKALNDFRIGKRTQNMAEKIAKKYGLTTAKSIAERKKETNKELRKYYKKLFLYETQTIKSIGQLQKDLANHGVHLVAMKNKQGETQGFRFMNPSEKKKFDNRTYKSGRKKGEIPGIKASDVGKELSLKNMKKRGISFQGFKLTQTQQKQVDKVRLGEALLEKNTLYKSRRKL